jgi:hypothetical protein
MGDGENQMAATWLCLVRWLSWDARQPVLSWTRVIAALSPLDPQYSVAMLRRLHLLTSGQDGINNGLTKQVADVRAEELRHYPIFSQLNMRVRAIHRNNPPVTTPAELNAKS